MNIKLSKKQKLKTLNSDDLFELMQKILCRENRIERKKKHFWLIGLNLKGNMLFIELVSIGNLKIAAVEPMNIFRVAVLKGAVKVLLIQNHPSGKVEPSEEDKDITDRLIQVGKILAIEVLDHLIISEKSYLSFDNEGLLDDLKESIKWTPPFETEKKIKKEAEKIRREFAKAALERELEIAKRMKNNGIDIVLIARSTGLTKNVIKAL